MSDTDSFIDEVSEEVRRDRLFKLFKRYGWIAAALVVAVVAGASWSEYRKSQAEAKAQALGDSMLAALAADDSAQRAQALNAAQAGSPGGTAILKFLAAAEMAEAGNVPDAVAALEAIATDGALPEIYRQIASFKAITLQADTLPTQDRRLQLQTLASPGVALRLLAEEQLALIDIEDGDTQAAIDRMQAIVSDAEVTSGLQQRALQVIVALGGTPDLNSLSSAMDGG